MKRILFLVGLLATASLFAQEISKPEMDKIRASFKKDAYTKAMQNALSLNDLSKLAWNRENVGTTDHLFTYKVDVSGITDQKSSGRCWMFSSLNLFRPVAMKKFNVAEFEFSENYLYFYDLLEKANLFLYNIENSANLPIDSEKVRWYLRSPLDDGGQWINFVNLAIKYGLVPKEAMAETNSSENTSSLTRFMKSKLREDALELRSMKSSKVDPKKIAARKTEMLSEMYRMLALNLGEPPTEFTWRYRNKDKQIIETQYNPKTFMDAVLGDIKLDDYVMMMNDPSRPYWKHYEIENYRNTVDGQNWHYVNLPNDVLKEFCIASIKNNEVVYSSCDVGKQMRREVGILDVNNFDYESVYGIKFGMNKAQRIQTGDSGSSHGMALVAVDIDKQGKPLKWQFENSWGPNSGEKGYLTFTDAWFDEYMFRIVVNKKYLTSKVLEIYGQKPEMLPPWDPMF